ncbi:MAG TPA: hypothetical protein VEQ85_15140 [Lacipirellulaceae bacterium]|nr:hypothetical protein [Lacipirellulaceae bacterium]
MFTRTSTLLVAVAAALLQPLAGVCLCGHCGPTARAAGAPAGCCRSRACEGAENHDGSTQADHAGRSCCSAAGDCSCGSPASAGGVQECGCGDFEHQPAVAAPAFDADHASEPQGTLPVAAVSLGPGVSQTTAFAFSWAHGPPVRFAGLRPHAFYCVWII